MRQLSIGFVLGLALIWTGCGGAAAPANQGTTTGDGEGAAAVAADSQYTIVNNSNYTIYYIYMSATSQSQWGPDQLQPDQTLGPRQSVTLRGVPCDRYDLKFVDEDGDECEQRNVEVCHNTTLYIENDALLQCEGYR